MTIGIVPLALNTSFNARSWTPERIADTLRYCCIAIEAQGVQDSTYYAQWTPARVNAVFGVRNCSLVYDTFNRQVVVITVNSHCAGMILSRAYRLRDHLIRRYDNEHALARFGLWLQIQASNPSGTQQLARAPEITVRGDHYGSTSRSVRSAPRAVPTTSYLTAQSYISPHPYSRAVSYNARPGSSRSRGRYRRQHRRGDAPSSQLPAGSNTVKPEPAIAPAPPSPIFPAAAQGAPTWVLWNSALYIILLRCVSYRPALIFREPVFQAWNAYWETDPAQSNPLLVEAIYSVAAAAAAEDADGELFDDLHLVLQAGLQHSWHVLDVSPHPLF
ncbi:hypothetical protein FRB90_001974 [Tulasnella sp. 427]|nr:hypothetical protein FRB90_001974 [Tulasnella sp. 427]